MNDQALLTNFLAEQKYMTISVTLDDGTPWATPVRIQKWEGASFEWDSKVDTEHSMAIAKRPNIAISMFTPEGEATIQFGFYAHATAEQISETNEAGVARYRAVANNCFINDASFKKRAVIDF
jgi:hypothetical protein